MNKLSLYQDSLLLQQKQMESSGESDKAESRIYSKNSDSLLKSLMSSPASNEQLIPPVNDALMAKDKARATALLTAIMPRNATVKFGKNYVI